MGVSFKPRVSVLDCGGPPPLFGRMSGPFWNQKRQRAGALQDASRLLFIQRKNEAGIVSSLA
jgi:hypothetical protein